MWAGIWIDGDIAAVADYLRAIAEDAPLTAPVPVTVIKAAAPTKASRPSPVIWKPAKRTLWAVIAARSYGHCEILTPECRLTLDTIASRVPGRRWHEFRDAAAGYAVCRSCEAAVARMQPQLAHRLGYLVDNFMDVTAVPFYWRQTHWLRLNSRGGARHVHQRCCGNKHYRCLLPTKM
jgi:hypothetical protein